MSGEELGSVRSGGAPGDGAGADALEPGIMAPVLKDGCGCTGTWRGPAGRVSGRAVGTAAPGLSTLATGVLRSGATDRLVGSVTAGAVAGMSVATGGGVGATSVLTGAGVLTGGGVASSADTAAAALSQSTAAAHRERTIMTGRCPL